MDWVVGVVYAGFLAGSGALAVIDARTKRLPNRIVFPLYALGAVGLTLASAVGHEWPRLVSAVVSAALLYGLFWLFWFFGPMGFGDVKLAGLLGLFLGWVGLAVMGTGLLLGMLAAAFTALALMIARKATLKTELAYGPYLIAGSWVALALQEFVVAR
ncbi:MAG TPA: A24 family peptidase [Actinospica sp.]|nr:A24 family peptidase [Actinospica sp.]